MNRSKNDLQAIERWIGSNWWKWEPKDLLARYRKRFLSKRFSGFELAYLVVLQPPDYWNTMMSCIVDDYTQRLVAERNKIEKDKLATQLKRFSASFAAIAAGNEAYLEAQRDRIADLTVIRRRKNKGRNEGIRKYASWLQSRSSHPITKKKELYQQIRDHFGFRLTDRTLQDILKSKR